MCTGFRDFPQTPRGRVSPYLGFTLYLSVFQCFGWFEAMRGRLIGSKTWDRIVEIFLRFFLLAVTVHKMSGLFVWQ